jgi:Tfp pilus assembly protein PilE
MKGFSLIQVITSIAIIGVLTAIVTGSFRTAQIKKQEQGITQALLASLDKQKANTVTGKNGSNYGVKINSTNYILFTGTSYATSSSNPTVTLDSNFRLTETIANATNIIYFSKLTGAANETATITVSHITNKVPPQNILIEASGAISVIE